MTNKKIVLVMDPSGNYKEGSGTTGWVLIDEDQKVLQFGNLLSKQYESRPAYHQSHLDLIEELKPDWLVCENYQLYEHKAQSQINSEMETPRLLGLLEHYAWSVGLPYSTQRAADVKSRWNDDILEYKQVIYRESKRSYINGLVLSRHIRDALRHAMHFTSFNKEWKKHVKRNS